MFNIFIAEAKWLILYTPNPNPKLTRLITPCLQGAATLLHRDHYEVYFMNCFF